MARTHHTLLQNKVLLPLFFDTIKWARARSTTDNRRLLDFAVTAESPACRRA
jgi:hypothetical protein